MKILLTGASGFLGSALAIDLLAQGHELSLLLRRQSSLNRLKGAESHCDVARPENDAQLCAYVESVQPDAVIHTACLYGRQGESTQQLTDANVRLGLGLLDVLRGMSKPVTFINTGTALAPTVNAYALSKHQFCQWGELLSAQTDSPIQWINVQLEHMYGPGDDASKFTTHVIRSCMRHVPSIPLTAGEQRRDLIYIEDVVSAYQTLVNGSHALPRSIDVQVGSGTAPTIREFVETAHRLTGSTTELRFGALPYRNNEAMHCQADIRQMVQLGWQPLFDLEAGLKKTIELEFP